MPIQKRLQKYFLSAAFAAVPGLAMATEGRQHPSRPTPSGHLQPAASKSVLRAVPETSSTTAGIRVVNYQVPPVPDQNGQSTVGAELQKIVQAKQQAGQPGTHGTHSAGGSGHAPQVAERSSRGILPALKIQSVPTPSLPKLVLTQHTVTESDSSNTRRAGKRDRKDRGPGLFKRIFSRLSSDSDEPTEQIVAGEPAPQIPQPPSIKYSTNGGLSGQNGPATSVPPQSAAYQRQKMGTPPVGQAIQTPWPQEQNVTQSLVPHIRLAASGKQLPSEVQTDAQANQPQQRAGSVDVGFINPFTADEPRPQADVLLDLDSLIRNEAPRALVPGVDEEPRPAATAVAQNKTGSRAGNPASGSGQAEPVSAESPYTGYQLDPDEEVVSTGTNQKSQPPTETSEQKSAAATTSDNSEELSSELEDRTEDLAETAVPLTPVDAVTTDATDSAVEAPGEDAAGTEEPELVKIPLLEDDTPADTTAELKSELPAAAGTDGIITQDRLLQESRRYIDSLARRDQQRYRIMSRTGQTGFKGFCPVELRDHRELVDHTPEFSATFGLRTYHFSSAKALAAFQANPSRYAPAAGGSDVVVLVNTGEEVPGVLDFSLWYRDRLYMFRSRESQQIFSEDPGMFADQY